MDVASDGKAGAEPVPGRKVDAVILAANRQLCLGINLQPVVEKFFCDTELEDMRLFRAAILKPVVGQGDTGPRGKGVAMIFDQRPSRDPPRVACQIVLVPGAAANRPFLADAKASVRPPIRRTGRLDLPGQSRDAAGRDAPIADAGLRTGQLRTSATDLRAGHPPLGGSV